MASKVENVYAAMPAVTGALRNAPLGTTAPTGASDSLDPAFVDLGYIGEDGFTESTSRDTDKKKAFGGSTVKVLQTDFTATLQFTFLESLNADVLKAVYGPENVSVDGDSGEIKIKKNKKVLPHSMWVIDTVDGDAVRRNFVPNGQITEVDDVVIVHSDTIMYTVTIEAFENEDEDNMVEWVKKPNSSESPNPPALSTEQGLSDGQVGVEYTGAVTATGGTAPLTYAVTSGSLPEGLTMGSDGTITGMPTTEESQTFTVTVTDANSLTDSGQFTLDILP